MSKQGAEYIASPTKRRLDVLGCTVIAASLAAPATAVGVEAMVEHRRLNPFFRQERVGHHKQPITVYKFETLHTKDPAVQLHGGFGHPGASTIGRLVRRLGLDEVPQLLNVVNGDISLVGIRPVPANYLEYYASFAPNGLFTEWRECYDTNLGLTGRGQLFMKQYSTQSPTLIEKQMEIEVNAFETASLKNDLQTLAATPVSLIYNALLRPNVTESISSF